MGIDHVRGREIVGVRSVLAGCIVPKVGRRLTALPQSIAAYDSVRRIHLSHLTTFVSLLQGRRSIDKRRSGSGWEQLSYC